MIELDALTKRFGDDTAVDALTLSIERGELLVLLGGSGCGKTTTLKMVNRLVEPTSGHVRIDGHDTRELSAPELRRRIGYCFQQIGLFPHMSVAENVGITPSLLGWEPERIRARVSHGARSMEALGLEVKGLWLVDFDNGEGYYCWRWPEPDLAYFHGYDEGYSGRIRIQ